MTVKEPIKKTENKKQIINGNKKEIERKRMKIIKQKESKNK